MVGLLSLVIRCDLYATILQSALMDCPLLRPRDIPTDQCNPCAVACLSHPFSLTSRVLLLSLRIVNTYGAFGSITKERGEIILKGTTYDSPFDPAAEWREYGMAAHPPPSLPPAPPPPGNPSSLSLNPSVSLLKSVIPE